MHHKFASKTAILVEKRRSAIEFEAGSPFSIHSDLICRYITKQRFATINKTVCRRRISLVKLEDKVTNPLEFQ